MSKTLDLLNRLKDATQRFYAQFPKKSGIYASLNAAAELDYHLIEAKRRDLERMEREYEKRLKSEIGRIDGRLINKTIFLEVNTLFNSEWLHSAKRAEMASKYSGGDYSGADIAENVTVDPISAQRVITLAQSCGAQIVIVGVINADMAFALRNIFGQSTIIKPIRHGSALDWARVHCGCHPQNRVLLIEQAGIELAFADLIEDLQKKPAPYIKHLHVSFQASIPAENVLYREFSAL